MDSGQITTAEDLFGNRIRILIDEKTDQKPEIPEQKKLTNTETTDTGKRKRRTAGEIQSAVIKAYDCGNRNITQVMEIAKVDYKTARKYLPISKEG